MTSHIVGIGVDDMVLPTLATKCWMSFPEPDVPFYRVTVLSNYPPHNVLRPGRQWSLLCEVSESPAKPLGIWSRGHFGAWKYEVSNQDPSLMQGVEAVDHILTGAEEATYHVGHPPGSARS